MFYVFGFDVIGVVIGKKFFLVLWVEIGCDVEVILQMVDGLKDSDLSFCVVWDMFCLVFGQDLLKFGKEEVNLEVWDCEFGCNGFWIFNGDVVKSFGEWVVVNWLFYNGILYVYEVFYKVDIVDVSYW